MKGYGCQGVLNGISQSNIELLPLSLRDTYLAIIHLLIIKINECGKRGCGRGAGRKGKQQCTMSGC